MNAKNRAREPRTRNRQNRCRMAFTWVEMIVLIFAILIIAAIFFPVTSNGGHDHKTQMLSNIKQVTIGFLMYSADHDDHLPPANNWIDDLMPYVKNEQLFIDIHNEDLKEGENGIAFYQPVSGIDLKRVYRLTDIPLAFQSTLLHRNASSDLSTLPNPPREEVNYVSFLDGHAKAFSADWPETPITLIFLPDLKGANE